MQLTSTGIADLKKELHLDYKFYKYDVEAAFCKGNINLQSGYNFASKPASFILKVDSEAQVTINLSENCSEGIDIQRHLNTLLSSQNISASLEDNYLVLTHASVGSDHSFTLAESSSGLSVLGLTAGVYIGKDDYADYIKLSSEQAYRNFIYPNCGDVTDTLELDPSTMTIDQEYLYYSYIYSTIYYMFSRKEAQTFFSRIARSYTETTNTVGITHSSNGVLGISDAASFYLSCAKEQLTLAGYDTSIRLYRQGMNFGY